MSRTRAWSQIKRLLIAHHPPTPLLRSPLTPLSRAAAVPLLPFLRFFSTNLAFSEPENHGFVGGSQEGEHRHGFEPQDEEEAARYIPVKAYFLSTSIDLKGIQSENSCNVIPATSRSSNYVALRYSDDTAETTDIAAKENTPCQRYVIAFQYGSAVLFNIADHEAEQYLDMVRKHATGVLPEMRKDDYAGDSTTRNFTNIYCVFLGTPPIHGSSRNKMLSPYPTLKPSTVLSSTTKEIFHL